MAAVIQNPLKALGDQFYREAIEHCRSYNARLCAERSVRLPFLDSQTGVAQNNCYIWMERHHRGPGATAGQMYTYPARCWRKKRRLHPSMDPRLRLCSLQIEGGLAPKEALPTPGTTLEALLRGESLGKRSSSKDEESLLEIQRVLEADANEAGYHDEEDFDVDIRKRKHRGKGRGRGSGRKRTADQDKPYACDNRFKQRQNSKTTAPVCGKRYRNRPGLSYHYNHLSEEGAAGGRASEPPLPSSHAHRADRRKPQKNPGAPGVLNNDYCSSCQGSSNRKTGKSRQPGCCSGCGRSSRRLTVEEEDTLAGAEELFGTTSESDTSTFHGFEDDELDEPSSNGSEASAGCR